MNRKFKYLNLIAFFVGITISALSCVPKVNDDSIKNINAALVPGDSDVILSEVEGSQNEIDTSDWKTYRNEEYGFEFMYPDEYEIAEDRKIGEWFKVSIKNDKQLTISNLPTGFESAEKLDNFNIDNQDFQRSVSKGGDFDSHIIVLDGGYYIVYSFETSEELKIFEQVAKTFKN